MDPVRFSVRVSRSVTPTVIELPPFSSSLSLHSTLLKLYDYPVATEVHLHRLEGREEEINLASVKEIDSRFSSSFLISFVPMTFDFAVFYRSNLASIIDVSDPIATEAFHHLLMHEIDQRNHYGAFIFRQLMLCYAITDIIEGRSSFFSGSLSLYLKDLGPTSLFPREVLLSALSDTFSVHLADRYLWDDPSQGGHWLLKLCDSCDSKACLFGSFLVDLILGNCEVMPIIKEVLTPYRPSCLIVYVIVLMTRFFLERLDSPAVFRTLSEFFSDSWLYGCFPDDTTKTDFIYLDTFIDIFPFFGIRIGFEELLKNRDARHAPLLDYYSTQDRALNCLRYTKAIAVPLFEYIYHVIQKDELVPVLVMSQPVVDDLTDLWNKLERRIRTALSFSQDAQLKLLDIMANEWLLRSFEPKGFCYVCISQMANIALFDEVFIRTWIEKSCVVTRCYEAVLIELNPLVLSRMTDERAVLGDEVLSTEKNLPAYL
jgi:hypothetical protein